MRRTSRKLTSRNGTKYTPTVRSKLDRLGQLQYLIALAETTGAPNLVAEWVAEVARVRAALVRLGVHPGEITWAEQRSHTDAEKLRRLARNGEPPTVLSAADVALLPVGSLVFRWVNRPDGVTLVVLPGGDLTQAGLLPEYDGGEEPGGATAGEWGEHFVVVKMGRGRLPTQVTAQRAAVDWMRRR